jgi:signal transduction histidine kinase
MAGIAHDLRAPLMTIASAAQGMVMSLDEEVSEDAQSMAAQLLFSVGRMSAMIDGFLRNARAGEALEVADVDVDALVALTLVSLTRQLESAEATVEVAALGGAHVDADQLGSVFMNLIDNAIRHRAPGRRPLIRIWAEDLGDERMFVVADNGPGILPQDRDRVLRLFERADPMVAGSGIGLAVCQRIIEAHGGRIWLSDNPQGGTTVRFSVPAQARST